MGHPRDDTRPPDPVCADEDPHRDQGRPVNPALHPPPQHSTPPPTTHHSPQLPSRRVLDVAQVVRRLTGLSLWRSKVLATQVPARILDGVLQEDAEAAVAALRDVGAQAEVRAQPEPEFVKA
ncbi:ribosomal protein L7/L12 [Streptomyces mirabilis]|uniref:ribosomal protein L7/L12 n=1 Tax=Streptomyces mirabilis TaxID=68239 RepID=UPI003EBCFE46